MLTSVRWSLRASSVCSPPSRARPVRSLASGRLASCLFLSSLWPEPDSSAAGVRTEALLRAFRDWGYDVSYAATAAPKPVYLERLRSLGVVPFECGPNDEAALSTVLDSSRPSVVIFDRFFTEEAFSFRVRELAPEAIRVLDMQDMHSLRRTRQHLIERGGGSIGDAVAHRPSAASDELLRELASVHRSDLTLVCSPVELGMLQRSYGVPAQKLRLASFFCDEAAPDNDPTATGFGFRAPHSFGERRHFVTIGGFKHPPNVDGVKWLSESIWPLIRAALPDAEMHVYGAYPTRAVQQLHKPRAGFHIRGHVASLEVLASSRVLLAPIRYGAGIKGKIVDAWRYGLPVVATSVAAEGMHGAGRAGGAVQVEGLRLDGGDSLGGDEDERGAEGHAEAGAEEEDRHCWGGRVADEPAAFAAAAVALATDAASWEASQARGRELLRELYGKEGNLELIKKAVEQANDPDSLAARRAEDFTGAMLWHQTARSTEFFSRWIELKESVAGKPKPSGG
jgi:hypothetical protein